MSQRYDSEEYCSAEFIRLYPNTLHVSRINREIKMINEYINRECVKRNGSTQIRMIFLFAYMLKRTHKLNALILFSNIAKEMTTVLWVWVKPLSHEGPIVHPFNHLVTSSTRYHITVIYSLMLNCLDARRLAL